MSKPILTSLVSALMAAVLVTTTLGTQRQGLYPEAAIRKQVVKLVMPEFPAAVPIDSAQGLVVVAVVFDEEGKFSQAEVLDAPHPLIKQAVLDALKLWETGRFGGPDGPHQLCGWLSFDSMVKDGKGSIEYTQRSGENSKRDKRFKHPFARTNPRTPFFYQ